MKKPKKNKKGKKKRQYRTPPSVRKKEKKFVWLNVLPDNIWVKAKRGETVLEALRDTDLDLEGDCGGLGKCGKCKIRVITSIGAPSPEESELLKKEELEAGVRLACRIVLKKNLVIHTELEDREVEFFQILKHGDLPEMRRDPLLESVSLTLPSPSLENPSSDFQRIRKALGPEYRDLSITYNCLSSIHDELRTNDYAGTAIIHKNCLLDWHYRKSTGGTFGIIFDMGTSTLVGKLINLEEGDEVAVASRYNSQRKYGSNIISRIQHVKENRDGLSRMQALLVRDLNIIIRNLVEAADVMPEDIFISVAAGNTTMQHFLLGIDPRSIAETPFTPIVTEGVTFNARDIGLNLNRNAILYIMPAKSGYIGGDLIGFILASKAAEQEEKIVLGMDFGTNGEIFLGNKRRIITCSAAAGPALEGEKITHGMIGKAGAIERFHFHENNLAYHVIGNIKPKGLCGSGLVDIVAILLHHGFIDTEGLLGPISEGGMNDFMESRLISNPESGVYDFLIASPDESFTGEPIYLQQTDIRELQLAKSAIAAGTNILLRTMGLEMTDVDTIYLAGALGNYVHPYSAMRIGLIPISDPEKISSLGNAASIGANMVLLSKYYWERATEITDSIENVELSNHPDFFDLFISEMDFHDLNLW